MFSLKCLIACGALCLMLGACVGMLVLGLLSGLTLEDEYYRGFEDGKNSVSGKNV